MVIGLAGVLLGAAPGFLPAQEKERKEAPTAAKIMQELGARPEAGGSGRSQTGSSGAESLSSTIPQMPVPRQNNPKADEWMDRKKNWIFATPEDNERHEKLTVEKAFGVRDYSPEARSRKNTGVVGRFLGVQEKEDSKEEEVQDKEAKSLREMDRSLRDSLMQSDAGAALDRGDRRDAGWGRRSADLYDRDSLTRRNDLGGNRNWSLSGMSRGEADRESAFFKQQREGRMSDFQQMLEGSRGSSGDPLKASAAGAGSGLGGGLPGGSSRGPDPWASRSSSGSSGPSLPGSDALRNPLSRPLGPANDPSSSGYRIQPQPTVLPFPKRQM